VITLTLVNAIKMGCLPRTSAMTDLTVANTIRAQLGNVATLLLGARDFVGADDSLAFSIKGCHRVNKVRIILDRGTDTYTVQFYLVRRRALDLKLVASVEAVHSDTLHRVIESNTGLATRL
jgi:hypothetical protein